MIKESQVSWKKYGVHGCTEGPNCKWKGMRLGRDGIAIGSVPSEANVWMSWHNQQCVGKIVQIVEPQRREGK